MSFFLFYSIVHMTGMFVLLGLILFAQYTKLDELESYFSENERVRRHKRFWKRNQRIDRSHRMGLMVDFLSDSKRFVKAGIVTEAELASVPLALKRWAVWPYRICHVWAVATVIWVVWYNW
ncbi:hypothetical protein ICY20_15985 [Pseudomonas sp. P115]|uniref:hypothetical protein n=1 Tax=Pseudomonas pisciculturae TaxID=2730413 RepID=UPI0018924FC1|nr:hypothetical protein [Pseudomonas pisciculturae]MBF6029248.1 hypothetical protein [Pseudomonas pisciculturae]